MRQKCKITLQIALRTIMMIKNIEIKRVQLHLVFE